MFLKPNFMILGSMGYPKGRTMLSNIFSNILESIINISPEAVLRKNTGNIHMVQGQPVLTAPYGAEFHGPATNATSFVPSVTANILVLTA